MRTHSFFEGQSIIWRNCLAEYAQDANALLPFFMKRWVLGKVTTERGDPFSDISYFNHQQSAKSKCK